MDGDPLGLEHYVGPTSGGSQRDLIFGLGGGLCRDASRPLDHNAIASIALNSCAGIGVQTPKHRPSNKQYQNHAEWSTIQGRP